MDLVSAILEKGDPAARKRLPAPCPEWPELDGKVFVTEISDEDFIAYIDNLPDAPTNDRLRVTRFLTFALVDADGKRIFGTDIIHMAKLAKLPMRVIRRWDALAQSLNHFGDAAKDAEKKSEPGASGISSASAA